MIAFCEPSVGSLAKSQGAIVLRRNSGKLRTPRLPAASDIVAEVFVRGRLVTIGTNGTCEW